MVKNSNQKLYSEPRNYDIEEVKAEIYKKASQVSNFSHTKKEASRVHKP